MKDNPFQLREKSVLLCGPVTSITASTAFLLAEMGANIALVTDQPDKAARIAQELANRQEIDAKAGRLHAINFKLDAKNVSASVKEAISLTAEALGAVDIYVDTSLKFPLVENNPDLFSELLKKRHEEDFLLAVGFGQALSQAFERRRKGRIIYLIPDLATFPAIDRPALISRWSLQYYTDALSTQLEKHESTANCVSIGINEEYLLSRFAGQSLHEAEKSFQKTFPSAKLCDTHRVNNNIAKTIAFLASPLGAGVSGQVMKV